jgi:Family of unknown function (DUF6058)
MAFTAADLTYIHAGYLTLAELCAGRSESTGEVAELIEQRMLPRPSYVLDDGIGMFPADYFDLVDAAGGPARLREHFAGRYRAACAAHDVSARDLPADLAAYLDGVYGICLRVVTPETIVHKTVLVSSLCQLLVLVEPRDPNWRRALRAHVAELDSLERDFAPDYDRSDARLRPPTRDLLIAHARERFGEVFAEAA